MKPTVALFCESSERDPVASAILKKCLELYPFIDSGIKVAGRTALVADFGDNQTLWCVPTETVASYDYASLSADLNQHFSNAAGILVVNWHAGNNAPAKIFCAHATSDVPSGIFGPTSSHYLSTLLLALESERANSELTDWRVLPEASHWSGAMVGRPVSELLDVMAPVYDLEIGSYADDFADPRAQLVVAKALHTFTTSPARQAIPVLFVGGTHFEPAVAECLLQKSLPLSFGHILPNQWLVSGAYEQAGAETRIVQAAQADCDVPRALVFHDGLKGAYKDTVRRAAAILGVPCVSHRKLRDPAFLQTLELETLRNESASINAN